MGDPSDAATPSPPSPWRESLRLLKHRKRTSPLASGAALEANQPFGSVDDFPSNGNAATQRCTATFRSPPRGWHTTVSASRRHSFVQDSPGHSDLQHLGQQLEFGDLTRVCGSEESFSAEVPSREPDSHHSDDADSERNDLATRAASDANERNPFIVSLSPLSRLRASAIPDTVAAGSKAGGNSQDRPNDRASLTSSTHSFDPDLGSTPVQKRQRTPERRVRQETVRISTKADTPSKPELDSIVPDSADATTPAPPLSPKHRGVTLSRTPPMSPDTSRALMRPTRNSVMGMAGPNPSSGSGGLGVDQHQQQHRFVVHYSPERMDVDTDTTSCGEEEDEEVDMAFDRLRAEQHRRGGKENEVRLHLHGRPLTPECAPLRPRATMSDSSRKPNQQLPLRHGLEERLKAEGKSEVGGPRTLDWDNVDTVQPDYNRSGSFGDNRDSGVYSDKADLCANDSSDESAHGKLRPTTPTGRMLAVALGLPMGIGDGGRARAPATLGTAEDIEDLDNDDGKGERLFLPSELSSPNDCDSPNCFPEDEKDHCCNDTMSKRAADEFKTPVAAAPVKLDVRSESGIDDEDEGWRRATTADGRPYWYCRRTRESSWTRPVSSTGSKTKRPDNGDAPIDGASLGRWCEAMDAKGRSYYYNTLTREVAWTRPVCTPSKIDAAGTKSRHLRRKRRQSRQTRRVRDCDDQNDGLDKDGVGRRGRRRRLRSSRRTKSSPQHSERARRNRGQPCRGLEPQHDEEGGEPAMGETLSKSDPGKGENVYNSDAGVNATGEGEKDPPLHLKQASLKYQFQGISSSAHPGTQPGTASDDGDNVLPVVDQMDAAVAQWLIAHVNPESTSRYPLTHAAIAAIIARMAGNESPSSLPTQNAATKNSIVSQSFGNNDQHTKKAHLSTVPLKQSMLPNLQPDKGTIKHTKPHENVAKHALTATNEAPSTSPDMEKRCCIEFAAEEEQGARMLPESAVQIAQQQTSRRRSSAFAEARSPFTPGPETIEGDDVSSPIHNGFSGSSTVATPAALPRSSRLSFSPDGDPALFKLDKSGSIMLRADVCDKSRKTNAPLGEYSSAEALGMLRALDMSLGGLSHHSTSNYLSSCMGVDGGMNTGALPLSSCGAVNGGSLSNTILEFDDDGGDFLETNESDKVSTGRRRMPQGNGDRGPFSTPRRDPSMPRGYSNCVWCDVKVPSSELSRHLLRCEKQRRKRRLSNGYENTISNGDPCLRSPFDAAAVRHAFLTPSAKKASRSQLPQSRSLSAGAGNDKTASKLQSCQVSRSRRWQASFRNDSEP